MSRWLMGILLVLAAAGACGGEDECATCIKSAREDRDRCGVEARNRCISECSFDEAAYPDPPGGSCFSNCDALGTRQCDDAYRAREAGCNC